MQLTTRRRPAQGPAPLLHSRTRFNCGLLSRFVAVRLLAFGQWIIDPPYRPKWDAGAGDPPRSRTLKGEAGEAVKALTGTWFSFFFLNY